MLRARPKHQLSSDGLVVEDYRQQNRDLVALDSLKSNIWVLIGEKVVLSNHNILVFLQSVTTMSPNLSLALLSSKFTLFVAGTPNRTLGALAQVYNRVFLDCYS